MSNATVTVLLLVLCAVMEVACGEYGDMVPPLVVAVQNNQCALYQCPQKMTNCDKLSATPTTASLVDHNTLRHRHRPDVTSDVRETDILNDDDDSTNDVTDAVRAAAATADDESVANRVALLHNSCRQSVPTLVLSNGDISCDVTLLKEVSCSLSLSSADLFAYLTVF